MGTAAAGDAPPIEASITSISSAIGRQINAAISLKLFISNHLVSKQLDNRAALLRLRLLDVRRRLLRFLLLLRFG